MGRRRKRLTITLKAEILKKLDSLIDGVNIRNRSHAIEQLLTQVLAPKISQVVILAGGEGVKMRPLTYELPKPLISVHGRPILEYLIDLLKKYEIRNLILATGYLGERIRDYFGNGSRFGVKISYKQEAKSLGTAGALRHVQGLLNKKNPFLVFHGDILTDINLENFFAFHQEHEGIASMALAVVKDISDVDLVRLQGRQIQEFVKKPKRKLSSGLVNSGIYIFNPEILECIPKKGKTMLEDIFPKLARENKLFGFPFSDSWFDVSTPKAYEEALKNWKKK